MYECRGVINVVLPISEAHHRSDSLHLPGNPVQRGQVVGNELRAEQQVLRRVSRQGELGKDDQIGSGLASGCYPMEDKSRVPVEIADGRINLGQCDP
jgi:hypothetical protein